jgi:hypothetical protein
MVNGFLFVSVEFGLDCNNIDEMAFMGVCLFNNT